jgi:hypothetical protein
MASRLNHGTLSTTAPILVLLLAVVLLAVVLLVWGG